MPHSRLCNDCRYFIPVPFRVGTCGRLKHQGRVPLSICDERFGNSHWDRGEYTCGQGGFWFRPKEEDAAA